MNTPRRNYRKYTNRNPLQRWLVGRWQRSVVELATRSVQKIGAPRVLEVGCGEGFVLERLSKERDDGRYCGLDVSSPALRGARYRLPAVSLCQGDAGALPFTGASFHLVLGLEVLEHLEAPEMALDEMVRVAAGPVIISVPHQPFFSLANLARGRNLRTWGDDPEHVQHWRPARFLALVAQRLRLERVAYSFPWLIVVGEGREDCLLTPPTPQKGVQGTPFRL